MENNSEISFELALGGSDTLFMEPKFDMNLEKQFIQKSGTELFSVPLFL